MRIARAPYLMRPQHDCRQTRPGGDQHELLRQRLGLGVMARKPGRVGYRFIDPFQVCAIEYHAGRTGVNQSSGALSLTGLNDVFSADGVGAEVISVTSPRRRFGCGVKYHLNTLDGGADGIRICQITPDVFNPHARQKIMAAAAETAHRKTALRQLADDSQTQEASPAGDQHGFVGFNERRSFAI